MLDEAELGMETLGMQSQIATLDEIKPHRISLQPREVLESPRAHMSSQYLCSTTHPDSTHIIHEVQVRDHKGEMQRVRALINCSATSIFMSPRLRKKLGLADEAVGITTIGLDGRVMESAKNSQKVTMTVQYLEHLAPVDEQEVLVVPIQAYDLVLGLPWFTSRNPNIDWTCRRLNCLGTPYGVPGETELSRPDDSSRGNCGEDPPAPPPDIGILGSTAFNDLSASDEDVTAFALQIGRCTGLLGATLDVNNLDKPGKTRALDGRAGSSGGSCGRRVTHWQWLNDCYRLAESRREYWMAAVPIEYNSLRQRLLVSATIPLHVFF
jgi:hypothetical protein